MPKYKAILFAPDGDWVTDYRGDTKEEVINQLANRGSCWHFYPYEAIILDKGGLTTVRQRLVDTVYPLNGFKGKSIATTSKYLSDLTEGRLDEM